MHRRIKIKVDIILVKVNIAVLWFNSEGGLTVLDQSITPPSERTRIKRTPMSCD